MCSIQPGLSPVYFQRTISSSVKQRRSVSVDVGVNGGKSRQTQSRSLFLMRTRRCLDKYSGFWGFIGFYSEGLYAAKID